MSPQQNANSLGRTLEPSSPRFDARPIATRAAIFGGIVGFLAFLPGLFLRGFFALPASVSESPVATALTLPLFLLPQYVFPMTTFDGTGPVSSWVWAGYWLLAATAFGFASQRWRFRRVAWVAPCAIVLLTGLLHLGIVALGWKFQADGP